MRAACKFDENGVAWHHSLAARRFASSLTVHVLDAQGLLQAYIQPDAPSTASAAQGTVKAGNVVSSTLQPSAASGPVPAAAVYVKVFARDSSGDEFFYK